MGDSILNRLGRAHRMSVSDPAKATTLYHEAAMEIIRLRGIIAEAIGQVETSDQGDSFLPTLEILERVDAS